MLPYSLRLALRHFSRKRIYSAIIVMSLTVGFACTCLLVSFLIAEENADSFHSRKERIFQLTSNDPFGGGGRLNFTTDRTRAYMIETYPEVENICQVTPVANAEAELDTKITPLVTLGVDTSFLTMFDFPLIAGSRKDIGKGVMISEEKARQIFGTSDVLDRMITLRTPDSVKLVAITGVIGKSIEKSHLKFDAIVEHSLFEARPPERRLGGVSYLLLRDGTDATALIQKINGDSLRPTLMRDGEMDYYLDPLQTVYTSTWNRNPYMQTRSETFIQVGWVVAGLILFMASFNFVNLFLLSMQERKKETGIQKTLGISLWQTIRGAAMEGGVYVGVSVVLSAMLTYTLMPIFNTALNADVEFNYMSRLKVFGIIVSILVVLMVVVVLITTIQHRRTLPVNMMRNVAAKVRFSKLFFTLQFFVSITLCVCCIAVIKQMKFVETAPLGFNRNMMQLNAPRNRSAQLLGDLKTRIAQIPGVENLALSSGNPISGNMIMHHELEDGTPFNPYVFEGDIDLVKTLDLELVEGSANLQAPGDMIVNETLVKSLKMKDPLGMKVPGTKGGQIIGVVKDFVCSSFKQEIPPAIISYKETSKGLLIDYGQNDIALLLPKIKSAWKEVFADDYFSFIVMQDEVMKKYSEETLFYKVVLSASITSMIISCFGLFALSWAVIRSRSKEMGIRKVLGASVANILGLLTVSFMKRLVFAFILAAPVGYYLMNLWLSRFVYKAPIDSWVFVITGGALAAIAVFTLGIQTLKASLSSPLNEIRE
jgi:putative ABC transport system permease protein